MRDYLGGYRFVDATNEDNRRSMMTAVWTDSEFDSAKMENRSVKPQAADPNVPSCFGCERDFRFQSLMENEPFRQNKWTVNHRSLDQTYDFYKQSMSARGWKESGIQGKLDKMAEYFPEINRVHGRSLALEKDGKTMSITILPQKDGSAKVFSMENYKEAQLILGDGKLIDSR